ncbi:hypothetical protein [Pectinatus frisingensis]|uniref:hypothetical protein n=1 Tax=Pectinatus frisingensis TaxID=865 RepID=UPI0018C54613|nr:hypothetical protein [Pectinatus frisingensis]
MNKLWKRIFVCALVLSLQSGFFITVSHASQKTKITTSTTDTDTKVTTKKYVKGTSAKTVTTTVVTATTSS